MPPFQITAEELLLNESFQNWVTRSNADDVHFWEAWIAAHSEHHATVQEAAQLVRLLYTGQKRDVSEDQVDRAIGAVTARMQEGAPAPLARPQRGLRPGTRFAWGRAAAVWVGLLLVSAAVYWGVTNRWGSYRTYRTEAGQTEVLQLPDGSKVVLNANSSLRFARNWGAADSLREVWLDGEGFFDVKHFARPARRFIVHAANVDVEVLGTTFNVWQRRNQTKVVLQTGQVRLKGKELPQSVLMAPGEIVELEAHEPRVVRRRVDPQLYVSWPERRIVFEGTPMPEVASFIRVRYGYQVQFTDSAAQAVTLTYKSGEDDFPTLLNVLKESFQVEADHDKKRITIGSN
jgi:ferric-dicitrate binding protein FerR (iron transport regulator)